MNYLRTRLGGLLSFSHTTYAWLGIALIMLVLICRDPRWLHSDVFLTDRAGYYLYLPSAFLLHDLGDTSWVQQAWLNYRPDVAPQWVLVPLESGKVLFKFPMGMAVFYAPFFFLAELAYYVQGHHNTTGFERAYEYLISLGCMAYVLLGLALLGRELRRFFADHVTALTLLIIGLGTNLLTYATYEALMAHGTLFLLNVLLLITTRRWYAQPTLGRAAALGLVSGLMVLVRPSELMLLAIPVLWGLTSKAALAARGRYWLDHWGQVLLIGGVFLLVSGQQFVFWRLHGGIWVMPFYQGERFYFDKPHVLLGLFSFRKGWLTYSPLMGLALWGLVWVRRWAAPVLPAVLLIFPVYVYVTFCWWSWDYGGSYGGRPMISLYPLLSFGLAAFWQHWIGDTRRLRLVPTLLVVLAGGLLLLSVAQNFQYSIGLINCCEMTWELYKQRFLQLHW